jgi:hypothetical protein
VGPVRHPPRRGSTRFAGVALLALGAAIAFAVQLTTPVPVPLYDGVPISEPYRYLHPQGGQAGDPSNVDVDEPVVTDGVSPGFAEATLENPPQAQLIALDDSFVLPPGAGSIHVSITPIDPVALPSDGQIAGNTYRVSVTDPAGNELSVKSCDSCVTLILRAPDGTTNATIERFDSGAGTWTAVATIDTGALSMFQVNPDVLGDFATLASGGSGFDLLVVGGAALLTLLPILLFVGFLIQRARSTPARPAARGRVPSKRRPPRPPQSSR